VANPSENSLKYTTGSNLLAPRSLLESLGEEAIFDVHLLLYIIILQLFVFLLVFALFDASCLFEINLVIWRLHFKII
jgi:hypothetical protein